jgi:hypothetical protein
MAQRMNSMRITPKLKNTNSIAIKYKQLIEDNAM